MKRKIRWFNAEAKRREPPLPLRPGEELWDWQQVARACGGDPPPSHNTIRRWSNCGILPLSITLGPGTVRWRASEVRAALKRRVTAKGWDKSKGKAPNGPWTETRKDQAIDDQTVEPRPPAPAE
jgi:predicted DNA-binding transcriptional regulator AlpA